MTLTTEQLEEIREKGGITVRLLIDHIDALTKERDALRTVANKVAIAVERPVMEAFRAELIDALRPTGITGESDG